jgi:hypothetical protein
MAQHIVGNTIDSTKIRMVPIGLSTIMYVDSASGSCVARERPYIRLRIRRSSRSSLHHDAPLQAPARACGATTNTLSLRPAAESRARRTPTRRSGSDARCQTAVTVRPNSKVSPGPKIRGNQSNAPHKRGLLLQGRDPPVPPRCSTLLRPQA